MAIGSSKASFKTSVTQYRTIMSELKKRNYSGSYLLMGDESYFIDKIADYIASTVVAEEDREFSQTIFYGRDITVEEVMASLLSYPMLSEKNVVIIKEAQSLKGIEHLQHYFKQPLDTTLLVVCYKGGTMDKRSAVYKKFAASGSVLESVTARDYEIGSYISEIISSYKMNIDPVALTMLIDYLGTSLTKIDNEIEKLSNRLSDKKTVITPTIIEENIGISKDFNNFELTNAISSKNKRRALLIASHFAQNPKDNPLVVTMSMLHNHFQRIFLLGLTIWQSKSKGQSMPNDREIMSMLKLTNVYFVKEYQMAVKHFPSAKSFKILELIRTYDAKSKGINTGSGGDGAILRELLLKIFAI